MTKLPAILTIIFTAPTALLLAPLAALHAADPHVLPPGTPNRAAWMAQGTYGVMTHYLPKPKGNTREEKTADLNRMVDQFDLDYFIRQFQQTGADWLIFTVTQSNGVLNSPNPRLDPKAAILVPRRDIVQEIAQRLETMNKRLILYLPSIQRDRTLIQQLNLPAPYTAAYRQFVRAYSEKFARHHHGWWFDSCAALPDEQWKDWLAACRAGNPEAVVAFSGAEFCTGGPVDPRCKLEDYHAGEIHLLEDGRIRRDFLPPGGDIVVLPGGKLRKRGQEARFYMPDAALIDGVQWHGLLPIDLTFNPAIPNQFCHYTDKELFEFVRRIKAVGGAITINVPINIGNGHIPEDSHSQLMRLSRALFSK